MRGQGSSSSLWRRIGIGSVARIRLCQFPMQKRATPPEARSVPPSPNASCHFYTTPPFLPVPFSMPGNPSYLCCARFVRLHFLPAALIRRRHRAAQKTSSKQTTLLRLLATSYGLLPLPPPPPLGKPRPRCTLPCSLGTN